MSSASSSGVRKFIVTFRGRSLIELCARQIDYAGLRRLLPLPCAHSTSAIAVSDSSGYPIGLHFSGNCTSVIPKPNRDSVSRRLRPRRTTLIVSFTARAARSAIAHVVVARLRKVFVILADSFTEWRRAYADGFIIGSCGTLFAVSAVLPHCTTISAARAVAVLYRCAQGAPVANRSSTKITILSPCRWGLSSR